MDDHRIMTKLGEGTFSEVFRVKNKITGKVTAMKKLKARFKSPDAVEGLREVQALRRLNPHPNIIILDEVIFDAKKCVLYLSFELMDSNLYELISRKNYSISEASAKRIMAQVFRSIDYMHSKGIFHRDIKPENILVKENVVKLADFGSCRGIHSKQPYTEYIATRWYRSPECLLRGGYYNFKMDIWAAGCVLFEVISKYPLFPGKDAIDQLHKIHNVLGTPSQKTLRQMMGTSQKEINFPYCPGKDMHTLIPAASTNCIDLLKLLLTYNPSERITAREALRHPYFADVLLHTSKEDSANSMASSRIHRKSEIKAEINVGVPSMGAQLSTLGNPSLQSVANTIAQAIQSIEQKEGAVDSNGSNEEPDSYPSRSNTKANGGVPPIHHILKYHRPIEEETASISATYFPKDNNFSNNIPQNTLQAQQGSIGGSVANPGLPKAYGSKSNLLGVPPVQRSTIGDIENLKMRHKISKYGNSSNISNANGSEKLPSLQGTNPSEKQPTDNKQPMKHLPAIRKHAEISKKNEKTDSKIKALPALPSERGAPVHKSSSTLYNPQKHNAR